MTARQLLKEAGSWCHDDGEGLGPTQVEQFDKYADELLRRGFIDEVEKRKWMRVGRTPTLVRENYKWHAEWD